MCVPAQGTALVDGVLNNERQDQHGVDVPNVQLLYPNRDVLPLSRCPASTPGVEVRLHFGLHHLSTARKTLPHTMRFVSTVKLLSERMLKYYKNLHLGLHHHNIKTMV